MPLFALAALAILTSDLAGSRIHHHHNNHSAPVVKIVQPLVQEQGAPASPVPASAPAPLKS